MPRGARKDTSVTKLLYDNGILLDKRSFVSLNANEPHLFLKGPDISEQRLKVQLRDNNTCRKCGRKEVSEDQGEVHHVLPRGRGGSDDLGNLEWRCGRFLGNCHTSEHIQTQFSKRLSK